MAALDLDVKEGPYSREELEAAAIVAARAFHTDPFFKYLAPRSVARARGLGLYLLSVCKNLGPRGRLLTARRDGEIVGVAAWVPPGAYPYPVRTQIAQQLGALRALYQVPPALTRGMRYLVAVDRAHPKEELWYLQLLATDPEHQRQGVGTELVRGVHEQCDREGHAAYLETQKESNLAYYGRFGYELDQTLHPVENGPPLWTMRRAPRSA